MAPTHKIAEFLSFFRCKKLHLPWKEDLFVPLQMCKLAPILNNRQKSLGKNYLAHSLSNAVSVDLAYLEEHHNYISCQSSQLWTSQLFVDYHNFKGLTVCKGINFDLIKLKVHFLIWVLSSWLLRDNVIKHTLTHPFSW